MEKPILTLRPSTINALLPELIKNIFYSSLFFMALFGVSSLLKNLDIISFSYTEIIVFLIVSLLLWSMIPLLTKLFILRNTEYHFFVDHLIHEFRFFTVKKHSLPYSQIVNIMVDISIWDRFCKAGDVVIHTAEDKHPDLTLAYIKEPQKVEKQIYELMRRQNAGIKKN